VLPFLLAAHGERAFAKQALSNARRALEKSLAGISPRRVHGRSERLAGVEERPKSDFSGRSTRDCGRTPFRHGRLVAETPSLSPCVPYRGVTV